MADVLVNLHGDEHRSRRRLENRLFRRETHARYERELFPPIVEETLAPHVAAGRAELVGLSHQMMMNLAAFDRRGRPARRHAGGDLPPLLVHDAASSRARPWRTTPATGTPSGPRWPPRSPRSTPSSSSRRSRADGPSSPGSRPGRSPRTTCPATCSPCCCATRTTWSCRPDVVLRETCFYLLAGAHTSATAFVRTLHSVFEMTSDHAGRRRAGPPRPGLPPALRPRDRSASSRPARSAMRWALDDVELKGGQRVRRGDKVVIDLMAANRDPAVFGDRRRRLRSPPGRSPTASRRGGSASASGMHACIGQELAAGHRRLG